MLKNTIRRRAQTAAPILTACQECGATDGLERHHPNYAEPDRFEVLCVPCHVKADQRDGHRAVKQPKACKVCGKAFMPTHSKNHSTCSRECLSAIGRMNAEKRWGSGRKSQTSPV
jgi:hypothetical protein